MYEATHVLGLCLWWWLLLQLRWQWWRCDKHESCTRVIPIDTQRASLFGIDKPSCYRLDGCQISLLMSWLHTHCVVLVWIRPYLQSIPLISTHKIHSTFTKHHDNFAFAEIPPLQWQRVRLCLSLDSTWDQSISFRRSQPEDTRTPSPPSITSLSLSDFEPFHSESMFSYWWSVLGRAFNHDTAKCGWEFILYRPWESSKYYVSTSVNDSSLRHDRLNQLTHSPYHDESTMMSESILWHYCAHPTMIDCISFWYIAHCLWNDAPLINCTIAYPSFETNNDIFDVVQAKSIDLAE